jgi:hypothetical protein
MAKSSKKAGKTSKKSKAAKAAKADSKRAAGKKTAAKKKTKKATTAALGCCTLRGSGPDTQIKDITREKCRREAIRLGKNFSWVAGECAEPC